MQRRTFLQALAASVAAYTGMPYEKALASVCDSPPSFLGGFGPISMAVVPATQQRVWNPGNYGGVPEDSWVAASTPNGVGPCTQHGTDLTPSDDIQDALDAAGALATKANRLYVKLGAGTWTISTGLSIPSYVVLRGTLGAGNERQSIIDTTYDGWAIVLAGTRGNWDTPVKVIGTLKPGDDKIIVSDASQFSVGEIIKLDQLSDGPRSVDNGVWYNVDFQGVTQEVLDTTLSVSARWNDNPTASDRCVFPNTNLAFQRADYNSPNFKSQDFPNSPGEGGDVDRGWRPIHETKEILAINGNELTVYSKPSVMSQDGLNADISGSPVHFWYYRDAEVYSVTPSGSPVEYAGVEDLTVYMTAKPAVGFSKARFCWAKNVETDGRSGNRLTRARHITLAHDTYRCEVTACYLHGQRETDPGEGGENASYRPGGAYGLNISGSEHYIHNNVVRNHNKPINFECAGGANVVAFNYVDNAVINNTGWTESGIGSHASFEHSALVEGNITPNVTFDCTHGNNGFNVVYRNHMTMLNTFTDADSDLHDGLAPGDSFARGFMSDFVNHEMAVIGNVLGSEQERFNRLYAIPLSARWYNLTTNPKRYAYACGFNGFQPGVDNKDHFVDDGYAFDKTYIHKDFVYLIAGQGGDQLIEDGSNDEPLLPSLHRLSVPDYYSGYAFPTVNSEGSTFGDKVASHPAKARYEAGEA